MVKIEIYIVWMSSGFQNEIFSKIMKHRPLCTNSKGGLAVHKTMKTLHR